MLLGIDVSWFSEGLVSPHRIDHDCHRTNMNLAGAGFSEDERIAYLQSLPSIRERCSRVHALAQKGQLQYFDYHADKEAEVISFCAEIIKVIAFRG